MATREDLVDTLEKIALLLDLRGENPFKIRAYRTGAEVVSGFPGDIVQKAIDDDLKGIKGIGDALQQKLHELATSGKLDFFEKLRAEFPEGIFELFDLPGLGPKKVKALYEALEIGSLESLKDACEADRVAGLPGFGKKTQEKILEGIAFREQNASHFRLGDVLPVADRLLDALREHPACSRAEIAGSLRRAKETVHDLDFLVATPEPEAILRHFVEQPDVQEIIAQGTTKASVRVSDGLQCDLRAVENAAFPFALQYFTGSKEHNVALRSRALKRGYTLNEYRLEPTSADTPEPPAIHDETDLYRFLQLDPIDPALRENQGEIEAAENDDLPRLLEWENLRGTFHNHTTESDGRSTLEEMAAAARELGLQYLGISDHSKSSVQANGLDEARLRKQIEAIAELNEGFAEEAEEDGEAPFRLFAGSEVDILRDGSLDFDDDLLGELDYTVASVHNAFSLPEKEMTKRILAAVAHPSITMLGHLTGRLLLEREAYAVNVPEIIDACAANGTFIELNCNPWRLDLDWRWWKLAREKGVRCVINPDAHRAEQLHYLALGVKVARKGWLTREDVLNCLPLGKIEDALKAKRLSLA